MRSSYVNDSVSEGASTSSSFAKARTISSSSVWSRRPIEYSMKSLTLPFGVSTSTISLYFSGQ